jgi:hypothetical protein
VSVNVLGASAHILLFEARDPFTDARLNFSLRFHIHILPSNVLTFRYDNRMPQGIGGAAHFSFLLVLRPRGGA